MTTEEIKKRFDVGDILNLIEPKMKRLLEKNVYDKIFKSDFGIKLKKLAREYPAFSEFIIGIISAVVQKYEPDNNHWLKTLSDLAEDIPSELGRRIFEQNGVKPTKDSAGVKRDKTGKNPFITMLGDKELADRLPDLVQWFVSLKADDKEVVELTISMMDAKEIKGFLSLSDDFKVKFCETLFGENGEEEQPEPEDNGKPKFGFAEFMKKRIDELKKTTEKLNQYIN